MSEIGAAMNGIIISKKDSCPNYFGSGSKTSSIRVETSHRTISPNKSRLKLSLFHDHDTYTDSPTIAGI